MHTASQYTFRDTPIYCDKIPFGTLGIALLEPLDWRFEFGWSVCAARAVVESWRSSSRSLSGWSWHGIMRDAISPGFSNYTWVIESWWHRTSRFALGNGE